MTNSLETAEQDRHLAESRLATLRAQAEAATYERALKLIESPQPVVVPWTEYPAYDGFNRWPAERPYLWSDPDDRTEDRYRPYYENADDLRRMRADARRLKALFPVAEGAVEALANYVIGDGFTFNAEPLGEGGGELAKRVQAVVDRFLAANNFAGERDREIHGRTREDGEAFLALYDRNGDVRIELIEPDYIVAPRNPEPIERMLHVGHKLNYWWLGVHTRHCQLLKRDNAAQPLGYHAVFDRTGDQWDYLPAARVEHIKRNVDPSARRGVSDFYSVRRDLELEAKIRRNTAEGAAILAAIVMIRQHAEGVQKSTIENMVSASSTTNYEKPIKDGTRTTYLEQIQPGTTKDIPFGMTSTLGPLGTLRSPVYIEVAQYLLRIIGHRWRMPEYMISGDASNANYSSTLIAESPFVKAREADQRFYAIHFERLIWKALAMYHAAGALGNVTWTQLRAAVTLKVTPPEVASRDPLAQAQWNELLHRNLIKSKRTWAGELGLDLDEETREMAAEPQSEDQPDILHQHQLDGKPQLDTGEAVGQEAKPAVLGLNGAQVTAAIDVLKSLAIGTLTELGAIELLIGIGIKPERAQLIAVDAARNVITPEKAALTQELGKESVDRTEQLAQWAIRSLVEHGIQDMGSG